MLSMDGFCFHSEIKPRCFLFYSPLHPLTGLDSEDPSTATSMNTKERYVRGKPHSTNNFTLTPLIKLVKSYIYIYTYIISYTIYHIYIYVFKHMHICFRSRFYDYITIECPCFTIILLCLRLSLTPRFVTRGRMHLRAYYAPGNCFLHLRNVFMYMRKVSCNCVESSWPAECIMLWRISHPPASCLMHLLNGDMHLRNAACTYQWFHAPAISLMHRQNDSCTREKSHANKADLSPHTTHWTGVA